MKLPFTRRDWLSLTLVAVVDIAAVVVFREEFAGEFAEATRYLFNNFWP